MAGCTVRAGAGALRPGGAADRQECAREACGTRPRRGEARKLLPANPPAHLVACRLLAPTAARSTAPGVHACTGRWVDSVFLSGRLLNRSCSCALSSSTTALGEGSTGLSGKALAKCDRSPAPGPSVAAPCQPARARRRCSLPARSCWTPLLPASPLELAATRA